MKQGKFDQRAREHVSRENSTRSHPIPSVADFFVDTLNRLGVEAVFGVPGGAIEPLFDALGRSQRQGGVRALVARHETSAAYMAQGYAMESGRLGVCCSTTGPGATNILTAVASAYADEVPMLVITGQTPANNVARAALQDSSFSGVNTSGIFQFCTRYNATITDPTQFERILAQALLFMHGDPTGPAHLSIASDVFRSRNFKLAGYSVGRYSQRAKVVDTAQVKALLQHLESVDCPVMLLGEYARGGIKEVLRLAELLKIPFATTPAAKGMVATSHPLNYGVFGFAGHARARELLTNPRVDSILAVGTRLGEWETLGWDEFAIMNRKMIHIDQYAAHFAYSPMAGTQVTGDIASVFAPLIGYFSQQGYRASNITTLQPNSLPSPVTETSEGFIHPVALMEWLSRFNSKTTCVYVDAGNSTSWGVNALSSPASLGEVAPRREWFRMSSHFASMGWAIGNVIGAAFANEDRQFICVTGDGSWLMNGQEFTVAVAEKLPILFVILNDHAYGMVKHGQRLARAEPIAFELPVVNYAQIACAMGGLGYRIENLAQLEKISSTLDWTRGPMLLDVVIDGEAVPPMSARVKVLQEAQ